MKESMPSSAQPPQAAQKPRTWFGVSLSVAGAGCTEAITKSLHVSPAACLSRLEKTKPGPAMLDFSVDYRRSKKRTQALRTHPCLLRSTATVMPLGDFSPKYRGGSGEWAAGRGDCVPRGERANISQSRKGAKYS